MSYKKAIHRLVQTENLLGIYRNQPLLPISVKLVYSVTWLLLFTAVDVYLAIIEAGLEAVSYLSTARTFSSILLGYYTRAKFQRLLSNFNQTHLVLYTNSSYNKKMNILYIFVNLSLIVWFIVRASYILSQVFLHLSSFSGLDVLIIVLSNVILFTSQYRIDVEDIFFNCICLIILIQLNCVIDIIEEECFKITNGVDKLRMPLTDWCVFYDNVCECAELLNYVFGLIMTLSLGTRVFYQIFTFYNVIVNTGHFSHWLLQLLLYIPSAVQLCALSISGQRVSNSSTRLRRRLAGARLKLEHTNPNYKPLCELLRLVATRPLRIKIFGSIEIGHALVPSLFMFFMSYLILALQINNIV